MATFLAGRKLRSNDRSLWDPMPPVYFFLCFQNDEKYLFTLVIILREQLNFLLCLCDIPFLFDCHIPILLEKIVKYLDGCVANRTCSSKTEDRGTH